jgi:hypothetical protein
MLPSFGWSTLFSIPKAAGMQLLLRIRNSPGALALRARGLLTTTRYAERALSIDEFDDLSIDQSSRRRAGRLVQEQPML